MTRFLHHLHNPSGAIHTTVDEDSFTDGLWVINPCLALKLPTTRDCDYVVFAHTFQVDIPLSRVVSQVVLHKFWLSLVVFILFYF